MKRLTLAVIAVLFAAAVLCRTAPRDAPTADATPKRIVAYFAEWGVYGRKYNVMDVPADKLTHINYAFAQIDADGEIAVIDARAALEKVYPGDSREAGALHGNFHQLQLLKKDHPQLKTLISVGGWSKSGRFSDAALTDDSRSKFARSCVDFIGKYGFDGVDIDWEFPVAGGAEGDTARPEDKENFTLLLAELRKQLDERGKTDGAHYLLTFAAPAGPGNYKHIELAKVAKLVDWINLMTYDFAGSWSPVTNFNAPLYGASNDPGGEAARKRLNVDAAVKAYRDAGVPDDKIVVGVPFYGCGWTGVKDVNDGLFQPHSKERPKGGAFEYRDLAADYVGKYDRHWNDEAKVPWLFDPKAGVMISYDDPESIRLKAEYVKKANLGGVMCWELSGDDGKASLLTAIHDVLATP
ncbi:MAG TPA: glycoside hydrolase family 18 protein [Gemmataceae bacterium]|nr:glycoside hydrolase family 18 protein [Gemmataceae bacterium]